MTHIEAMKQALDFLESGDFVYPTKLADALRLAIEQAEPYDQTSLELCDKCGWKTLLPGDCCLNCARQGEQQDELPGGWETRTVTGLDELVDALDYAERKGFLPDYIRPAWERFSYTAPPQQEKQEQEPVAFMFEHDEIGRKVFCPNDSHDPVGVFLHLNPRFHLVGLLYTAPPQRQPLTEEDLREALRTCPHDTVENLRVRWLYAKDFARAIERAYGIGGGE